MSRTKVPIGVVVCLLILCIVAISCVIIGIACDVFAVATFVMYCVWSLL